jgi:hypothetical protein
MNSRNMLKRNNETSANHRVSINESISKVEALKMKELYVKVMADEGNPPDFKS